MNNKPMPSEVRLQVKYQAKLGMRGRFFKLALLCLLLFAIQTAVSYAGEILGGGISIPSLIIKIAETDISLSSALFSVLGDLLWIPLFMGISLYALSITQKNPIKTTGVFEMYTDTSRLPFCLRYYVLHALTTLASLPLILGTLPLLDIMQKFSSEFSDVIYATSMPESIPYPQVPDIVWILIMSGAFISFILSVCTMAVPYLMVDPKEKMGLFKAIITSFKLIRGHFWETIVYELSFTGWYIFMYLTMWLGAAYVLPYKTMCDAYYVSYLRFHREVQSSENNDASV